MATSVTLTGTGVPVPDPDRAGAGTLVRTGGLALQFDAGRGTVPRLAATGTPPEALDALFLTHQHSDHLTGVADLLLTRWIGGSHTTTVVAPEGPTARFAERVLDVWQDDIAVRIDHVGHGGPPRVDLRAFTASPTPVEVWADGDVRVQAVAVHHEPVAHAVAYRVDGPDGAVVVSGDTIVCDEVEALTRGAEVLVHEIFLRSLTEATRSSEHLQKLAAYHADGVDLGAMAARSGVPRLLLTHLIPPPGDSYDEFVAEVRAGGFEGEVIVGPDLTSVSF